MPFRLPTLDEKAHESELTDLIETTKQEANPPLRTLHNIIGNFFKPSAVLAALGGTHSIQNFVSGATAPHQWAPSSPSKVNKDFITLRATVAQDIAALSELHPHIVERWFPRNIHQLDSDDFWHKATHMHTPPVFTSQLTSQPPLPSPSAPVLTFPLSMQIQTHVLQFDGLHDLLLLPVFYSYPLDRLISPGLPPFDSVALKHFLTSAHLRKLCFLKAYFSGWELYQSNTAALVFFEDANSVEMMAFGSISSYKQLFVFSFSSANDSFDYALLLQHMTPPPSLQSILSNTHAAWHLPPYLSIDNISSQVDPTPLFTPFGSSFSPIFLSASALVDYSCCVFESSHDAPMWRPESLPRFTGDFPFLRHAQFWLHLHNKYQEAHELPPAPFILLTRFTPGSIPSSPSILFCILSSCPPVDSISSSLCPHILVPNTYTDLTIQHYGVLFARPSELFFEFNPNLFLIHNDYASVSPFLPTTVVGSATPACCHLRST